MHIMPINNYSATINSNNIRKNCSSIPSLSFGAHIDEDTFSKTMQTSFLDEYEPNEEGKIEDTNKFIKRQLTKDYRGCLPMHDADFGETAYYHDELRKYPEILAKIHLTQDDEGYLPMHDADLTKVLEIHDALKDQPEVLAQIHLTQDKSGNLPIHYAPVDVVREIHSVLKGQPEVIAMMHLTDNNEGNLPIDNSSYPKMCEIRRAIIDAALNSDLDADASIALLEGYNDDGRYTEAIEKLKQQL